jgi:predicted TIM-barrel fold metal-dependent hydrolase
MAIDFPELKIIGIHLGWPWTEEMIAVAYKHTNVYMAGDAYGPRHWPKEFVHFINTWGQDKCLFGTDWPVVDFERATAEVGELDRARSRSGSSCATTRSSSSSCRSRSRSPRPRGRRRRRWSSGPRGRR